MSGLSHLAILSWDYTICWDRANDAKGAPRDHAGMALLCPEIASPFPPERMRRASGGRRGLGLLAIELRESEIEWPIRCDWLAGAGRSDQSRSPRRSTPSSRTGSDQRHHRCFVQPLRPGNGRTAPAPRRSASPRRPSQIDNWPASALTQTEGAAEVSPPFVKPTMKPRGFRWWACPRDSGP
jgi:hypothetical protein